MKRFSPLLLLLVFIASAQAEPMRVACLGDSITHGVGADVGWSWPDQLDRMLDADWDVRNFGHSGATIAKGDKHSIWAQKEYQNALLLHPDIVIILLGTNDTKPENWAHKNEFPRLYKELVASFQRLSSRPRVFCVTPAYVAKRGNFGINDAGVKEQIPMIQQVAADLGAAAIDLHAATDGKDELFKDNVHPSTAGATIIAKTVYKALTGKEWAGEIPAASAVKKRKPTVRLVENPGELTYREVFALIASECDLPSREMAAIREKFEDLEPQVAARIAELQDQIEEYDQLRMKYKHTTIEADKPLYDEYKGKVAATRKELAQYKFDANAALIALVPKESRLGLGAGCLHRYVSDRLAPIAASITAEQRRKIQSLCHGGGAAYAAINNTPERSIEELALYKAVYDQILDAEQKKRLDPQ